LFNKIGQYTKNKFQFSETMKKVITFLSLAFMLTIGLSNFAFAQNQAATADSNAAAQVDQAAAPVAETTEAPAEESQSFHQVLKSKLIE